MTTDSSVAYRVRLLANYGRLQAGAEIGVIRSSPADNKENAEAGLLWLYTDNSTERLIFGKPGREWEKLDSHKAVQQPRPATNYGMHGAGYDAGEKLNELIKRHWHGLNYWRRVGCDAAEGWRKGLAYDSAAMHRHVLRRSDSRRGGCLVLHHSLPKTFPEISCQTACAVITARSKVRAWTTY